MKTWIYALSIAFLSALAIAEEKETAPTLPNASLADVKWGTVVNDVPFNKDELAGKVVVAVEWGTKCSRCRGSLPDIAKLAKSGEKKGLVVVGFERQNSSKEEILKVLKSTGVEFPAMTGANAPGGTGKLPIASVFDVTGKLVFTGNPNDKEFDSAVKAALRDVKTR